MFIAVGTIAILIGLACLGFGSLSFFGGMMSDNPEAGNKAGSQGCYGVLAGVAFIAFGVWMVL